MRVLTKRQEFGNGWSIGIPTSFILKQDDSCWQAYDENRVVYVSFLILEGNVEERRSTWKVSVDNFLRKPGKAMEWKEENLKSKGILQQSQGPGLSTLLGITFGGDRIAITNINFSRPNDEIWAIDTWKSLRKTDSKD